MQIEPAFEAFQPVHAAAKPQVVWTTLVSDLETPVSAYLKIAGQKTNAFLLESVEGGAIKGRYSILGLDPDLIWRCRGQVAEVNRRPAADRNAFAPLAEAPLTELRKLLAESRIDIPERLPPMAAGVFGYLGYDMVRQMEHLPDVGPDPLGLPDSLFIRPTVVLVFDAVKDQITVVTPVRAQPGQTARAAYDRAVDRLIGVVDALDTPLDKQTPLPDHAEIMAGLVSNTSEADYSAMVDRAKDYIAAGDIFQVVLSQRFSTPFTLPPFSLYRALRRVNPSPFLYYLAFDGFAVAGSSPEILVRVRDGRVTIRPIAGTRPRGATPADDKRLGEELLADPKERSEHLMLLDLGRNDVGRVARIGTVEVTDQFFLEHYSHVMHIVSNVEGEIDPKHDLIDALAAGFPAGTVSGAPKVRAMQIIDELEKEKRGLYAGCVGYFSANGAMDTCIVLRTAVVKDGQMYVQAGAGIVADSVNAMEQAECVNKAKALLYAADEAVKTAARAGRGQ
jgi:anthranilate synthase component 1